MISTITHEIINGVLEKVQTIKYSNGKIVKRILDKITETPISIIVVKEA